MRDNPIVPPEEDDTDAEWAAPAVALGVFTLSLWGIVIYLVLVAF